MARKSFLSLWSFPNLYRDSGRTEGKGDGQELSDLLVLFNEHVLIFSDKHVEYPKHTDDKVAWARWYRHAIEKSAKQLVGARNWIQRFPERVFLDSACTVAFPLKFPPLETAKFHLIAVTRGSHDACRSYFNNESFGTLTIDSSVQGKEHHDRPFCIGRVLAQPFIHVLNELSLEVVLRELDTVTDFVRYLERRELFLTRDKQVVMAPGEEQLTAIYLTKMNSDGRHDFVLPKSEDGKEPDTVYFQEGFWESFVKNPQYQAKKAADRISYAWDNLIEHFVKYGEGAANVDTEHALRYLASESRFSRRHLSEQLIGAISKEVPDGQRFARCGTSADDPRRAYVFLVLPRPSFVPTYEQYRLARRNLLEAYCEVAKLLVPDAHIVIGIATEPRGTRGATEDLAAVRVGPECWDAEREGEARRVQEKLGLFHENTRVMYKGNSQEFPDVPAAAKGALSPAQRLRERERVRNLDRLRSKQFTRKNRDPSQP